MERIDAMEMRENIVSRFGQTLVYGGSPENMNKGVRKVRLLADVTGISFDELMEDIKEDVEEAFN